MGIQGLLPLLKECQRVAHLREYKGKTLGIDAYVWLHRGVYSCAQEVATGIATVRYVKYAMHRVRLLKHYGITPYVVFDGGPLPSKIRVEKDREQLRTAALSRARALTAEGRHAEARDSYVKAVDVTPQMAYQLIKALKAENIDFVVAPYEADAQLAYLEQAGLIEGIVTEDSDLLVFGCKTVLFKLDADGACMEIKRDDIPKCTEFSFAGWGDQQFRQMAILSGCDYLDNIQGLGIKRAHTLMRKYKSANKVIRFLRLEGQIRVPQDYERDFTKAELTFAHQRVFDPVAKRTVHLSPPSSALLANIPVEDALSFAGPYLADDIATRIACGDLCPISKARMIDIAPGADLEVGEAAARQDSRSITDFFKPKPPDTAKASRRVLSELRNNIFSKAPPSTSAPSARPGLKSRFFAPAKIGVVPETTTQRQNPSDVIAEAASATSLDNFPGDLQLVSIAAVAPVYLEPLPNIDWDAIAARDIAQLGQGMPISDISTLPPMPVPVPTEDLQTERYQADRAPEESFDSLFDMRSFQPTQTAVTVSSPMHISSPEQVLLPANRPISVSPPSASSRRRASSGISSPDAAESQRQCTSSNTSLSFNISILSPQRPANSAKRRRIAEDDVCSNAAASTSASVRTSSKKPRWQAPPRRKSIKPQGRQLLPDDTDEEQQSAADSAKSLVASWRDRFSSLSSDKPRQSTPRLVRLSSVVPQPAHSRSQTARPANKAVETVVLPSNDVPMPDAHAQDSGFRTGSDDVISSPDAVRPGSKLDAFRFRPVSNTSSSSGNLSAEL